ncbi:hypothetical protein LOK49_LG04G00713 [Camellia lanceoleosa]|uniref:Uncharacterized protein n=1 Tax=Camellia lanceoleosa TaxID=1840588 RepID=A0ACC0HZJ7_9ERIC|nr:hypothetical protein LOK49_LG04G00713 [Camellia lanceoleosa]
MTPIVSKFPSRVIACCSALTSCFTLDHDNTHYYVLNLTTKKFSTIPRPSNGDDQNFIVSINLAFDLAVLLYYKIIAVYPENDAAVIVELPYVPHKPEVGCFLRYHLLT